MSKKESLELLLKIGIIGTIAEVIESKNACNKGIKGFVIDETRNTITIQEKEKKRLIKKNNTIMFCVDQKKIIIKGDSLIGKPEERIKKWLKSKTKIKKALELK